MNGITIALTKGRILKETLPLLASVGIKPEGDLYTSRQLIFSTNHPDISLILLRGSDVPTYVKFGSADLGVVGKDILLESDNTGFYEPLDLKIAKCDLMTATKKGAPEKAGRIRVATKYINSAKKYYAMQGRQVDLIKLYGAMELAPIMDLADEIVDIVDTGNTLRANGLVAREFIQSISSRLIVNEAAFKTKYARIQPIIDRLANEVSAL